LIPYESDGMMTKDIKDPLYQHGRFECMFTSELCTVWLTSIDNNLLTYAMKNTLRR